ncbi:MAG: PEGA domain-containing protein [Limisphaerales bacterium]
MFIRLLLAAVLTTAGSLFAADLTSSKPAPTLRKTAIIVENRAGVSFNDKVAVLEDLVSSRIAGKGYSVISRDVVTRALKDYSAGIDANGKADGLDRLLEDSTSALRLAQNLGADFILIPTITTFGSEKKTYNGNGISTVNIAYTLRLSYKIIEAGVGGAIRGDTVKASKTIRQTEGLQVEDNDILNELLDDAATQLADAATKNTESLPTEVAKDKMVNFRIACTMTDPRQQPILISALGVTEDNHIVVTNQPVALQPMDVTVELDGVAIGSAPGSFQGYPGLHKLRLSREGFDVWERTINVYEGQNLRVALQMSDEGYARWKDTTDFWPRWTPTAN